MKSMKQSRELYEKARTMIPGGVNSPVRAFRQVDGTPIYFARAQGASCIDVDGVTRLDFCQSWGPMILGHAHPHVVSAVGAAAAEGLSFGACHPREVAMAEMILSAMPEFEKVRLVSSGTEAVMTALRMARGVTGRDVIVKFDGGYHGHSDGLLVKAGSGLATHAIASSAGIPDGIAKQTAVLPLDDTDAVDSLFSDQGHRIAGVIIEPLPANNGLLIQRHAFLQHLRNVTQRHGAMLIFDEVISGFRLRFGGYYQEIGIVPDLVTLGKIIGGGMPVGAVVGPADIMDVLSPQGKVYQAGTLSGNPVSLAAGLATLELLADGVIYQRLEGLGHAFEMELQGTDHPAARVIRQGSILWLYLDVSPFPRNATGISPIAMDRFTHLFWPMMNQGFYLPPSSYEVLFISNAHSEADVRALARAVANGLRMLPDVGEV